VLTVAQRHGASNLRVYGSIAMGKEHNSSDLDLLVDLSPDQSLLGLISLHPLIRSEILQQAWEL
jgi:predicted nucleotidyltransferase